MSSEEYVTDEPEDNETVATVEEGSVVESSLSNLIDEDPYSDETVQTIKDLMSRWKLLWPIPEGSECSVGDGSSVFSDSVATFSVSSSIKGPTPDKKTSKSFFTILAQEKIELKEIHGMLETYPALLRTKMKSDRRLPLHVACAQKFPSLNYSGNVLDYVNALVTDVADRWALIRTLAVSHTKGCSKTDKSGDLPVHLLARNFLQWEEEWKTVISADLAQVKVTSSDVAVFTRLYQTMAMCIDLVLQPIISNRELIRIGGSVGNMLPLHIAATFGVSFDVFQQILEGFPIAAAKPCELTGDLTSCDVHNATPLDLLDRTRSLPLQEPVTLENPVDFSTPTDSQDNKLERNADAEEQNNDSLSTRESSTSLTKESTQPVSPPSSESDYPGKNDLNVTGEENDGNRKSHAGTSSGTAIALSNFLESSKSPAIARTPVALKQKGTATSTAMAKPMERIDVEGQTESAGEPTEIKKLLPDEGVEKQGKPDVGEENDIGGSEATFYDKNKEEHGDGSQELKVEANRSIAVASTITRATSSASNDAEKSSCSTTDATKVQAGHPTQIPDKKITEVASVKSKNRSHPQSRAEEQKKKTGKAIAVATGLPAIAEEPTSPDKKGDHDNATKEAEQIMQGLMSWWYDQAEEKSVDKLPQTSASLSVQSVEDQKANLEADMRRATGLSNEQIEISKKTGFALEFAMEGSESGGSGLLGSQLDARTNARTLESFDDDSEYTQSVIADDLQSVNSMVSAQPIDETSAYSFDPSTRLLDISTHTEATAEIDEDIARVWNRVSGLSSISTPIDTVDAESVSSGTHKPKLVTFRSPQRFGVATAAGNTPFEAAPLSSGADGKNVVSDPYEIKSITPGSDQQDIIFDPYEKRNTAAHMVAGLSPPSIAYSNDQGKEETKEMETNPFDKYCDVQVRGHDTSTAIVPVDALIARNPEQSETLIDLSGDDNRSQQIDEESSGSHERFDQEFPVERRLLGIGSRTGSRRIKIVLCAIPVMILCTIAVTLFVTLGLNEDGDPAISSLQGTGDGITSEGTYQEKAEQWLSGSVYPDARRVQRYALACLYYSTFGVSTPFTDGKYGKGRVPGWLYSYGWLSSNNECTWYGISCNADGFVATIELPKNRLTGGLPSELTLLADTLEHLNVADNMVYNHGDKGVSFLGDLRKLTSLHIQSNDLVYDGIPSQIGLLTKLTELDVSYTLFNGQLRGEVFQNLADLTHLSIGGNAYNSSIPREIGELPSLRHFYADNAFLTGDLSFIEPMENIYELWIDKNPALTGTIPAFLGEKTSLGGFSATECNLQGSIPSEIGKLTDIELLWFYSNQLTGEVPSEVGNLTKLRVFEIQHNSINGTMPSQVCDQFEQKEDVKLEADCVDEVACTCCTECHRDK